MKYCIDFDTKDMAPHIKCVTVEMGTHIMRNMDEEVRIDLAEHPDYWKLQEYVLSNPRERPDGKRAGG